MQKSFLQQQQMSQQQFLQQQQQQQMMSMQNGIMQTFRVDTFEYRLLHEVEFRRSLTVRMAGEVVEEEGAIQGPPQAPQLMQKPRSTKVSDGGNATFTVKVSGYPTPRVRTGRAHLTHAVMSGSRHCLIGARKQHSSLRLKTFIHL